MRIEKQQIGDGLLVTYPIYFTKEIVPEESEDKKEEQL